MISVFTAILVAFSSFACVVSGADDDFNIDVVQQNAQVYHEQSMRNNEFNYGYQVENVNNQFQHKVKGPDDVTYGCYGYIDPNNEKQLVYYVADRQGYRIVTPDRPTKIFTDRVANSIDKLDDQLKGKTLDEKVVAWNDLFLPESCRRLNDILTITHASKNGSVAQGSASSNIISRFQPVSPATPPRSSPTSSVIFTTATSTPVIASTTQHPTAPPTPVFTTTTTTARPTTVSSSTVRIIPAIPSTISTVGIARTTSTVPVTQRPTTTLIPPIAAPTASNRNGFPQLPAPTNPNSNRNDQNQGLNLGPFNGYVYPIHGDCEASAYNVKQLMAQMEILNAKVLELTKNIQDLQDAGTARSPSCESWLARQQFPLLVYVPILLPYLGNNLAWNVPLSTQNSASSTFQKMCTVCQ
ncbi:uncharacterized protein LOC131439008 [Malaya genurostris]|uniref:uncharacterized protein LOC131439008 n=1 Tax=Malaya genurostris TaxID=325434 RepID=UPI0026F39506|nr:uncharacterized protein LOC131439008 [Malaya genurostris]